MMLVACAEGSSANEADKTSMSAHSAFVTILLIMVAQPQLVIEVVSENIVPVNVPLS
jgi:hypothetical protein